jgi:hypothetical protein
MVTIKVIYLPLYTMCMEYIEMIGWLALGFVPTLATLEYTTRKLARRTLAKLYVSNVREVDKIVGI